MNIRTIGLISIALLIGFASGYYFVISSRYPLVQSENCESKYQYISNRLGCQPNKLMQKHEYTELVYNLNEYIAKETTQGRVKHVSVYFRDLYAGPTFGIKEKEAFAPASLLKVPLLVTYLNLAEKDSQLLNRQLRYNKIVGMLEQKGDDIPKLKPNTPYKISELLSRMIIYSDNLSYWVLQDYLKKAFPDENPHAETMKELGIVSPRNPIENTITVKEYASIFRHLYNSSYLSPEMSEKALDLLSQTKYVNGLVAGVPKDVRLAHKFGELEGLPNGEKQRHDCGVVYYANNPYLICVMTRGDNYELQETIIKTISEKVYQEVEGRNVK